MSQLYGQPFDNFFKGFKGIWNPCDKFLKGATFTDNTYLSELPIPSVDLREGIDPLEQLSEGIVTSGDICERVAL
jgi:hypothetical protein